MYEALRTCLYLLLKCPNIDKRKKYIDRSIFNLSQENLAIIISILLAMGITMGSPD